MIGSAAPAGGNGVGYDVIGTVNKKLPDWVRVEKMETIPGRPGGMVMALLVAIDGDKRVTVSCIADQILSKDELTWYMLCGDIADGIVEGTESLRKDAETCVESAE